MKTFFNLFIVLILLVACKNSNEDTIECTECKTASYDSKTLRIGGITLNVRDFKEKRSNDAEFFSINTNENNIKALINNISKNNFTNLKGVILFSDAQTQITNLTAENVNAFAVYEKLENNLYNVRIFRKNNGKFDESETSNLQTTYFSSNDFINISKSINNKLYQKTFAIINFKGLGAAKPYKSELQDRLQSKLVKSETARLPEPDCSFPCDNSYDSFCSAQESQLGGEQWICFADPRACGEERMARVVEEKDSKKFKFKDIKVKLHKFRDKYLLVTNGGKKYVDMYYELSKNLNVSRIDYEEGVETFNVIEEVLPELESIADQPQSTEIIPINTQTADLLKNYLLNSSDLFDGGQTQEDINYLIMKIDEFTNKSNYYITTHL